MEVDQITKITLAWGLFENGIPKSHIADRLDVHRETVHLWTLGIASHKDGLIGFLEEYKNAKKGVRAKILTTNKNYIGNKDVDFSKSGKYEMKLTNRTLPSGIAIFKDIVATFVWEKVPYAFSIQNAVNAEQYRRFFNEIWKEAKR